MSEEVKSVIVHSDYTSAALCLQNAWKAVGKPSVNRCSIEYDVSNIDDVKRYIVDAVVRVWDGERKKGALMVGRLYVIWRGFAVNFETSEGVEGGEYVEKWHADIWMHC